MAEIDYSAEGVGKYVSLLFPNGKRTNHEAIVRILAYLLDPRVSVACVWEKDRRVLEFFWGAELAPKKINEALKSFLAEHPEAEIQFGESTCLTTGSGGW